MKCAGKDRELRQCRVNMKNGEKFCKLHLYMEEYTEEMMNHLTVCSTCKKAKYLGDSKICDSCKTRSKKNRKNVKKANLISLCLILIAKLAWNLLTVFLILWLFGYL